MSEPESSILCSSDPSLWALLHVMPEETLTFTLVWRQVSSPGASHPSPPPVCFQNPEVGVIIPHPSVSASSHWLSVLMRVLWRSKNLVNQTQRPQSKPQICHSFISLCINWPLSFLLFINKMHVRLPHLLGLSEGIAKMSYMLQSYWHQHVMFGNQ